MIKLKEEFSRVEKAWNEFWFAPKDLYALSLFRLVFCSFLFLFYLGRWSDFHFLFSERGLVPYSVLDGLTPEAYEPLIPWSALLSNETFAFILHGVFLLGLLALAFGWIGRNLAWLVFVLHLAFMFRNPIVSYGADMVSSFWLFLLCLTRSNQYLRIPLPGVKWRKHRVGVTKDALSTVGIRLIQIELCIVYAYSGLDKVKGATWWQGDAIWNSLANSQIVAFDLSFLHAMPFVIASMTAFTVLWEIYFPFLVWVRPFRRYSLSFGLFLHLCIGLTMNIPFFAIFMVASYLLFIDSEVLRKFLRRWTQKSPRLAWLS